MRVRPGHEQSLGNLTCWTEQRSIDGAGAVPRALQVIEQGAHLRAPLAGRELEARIVPKKPLEDCAGLPLLAPAERDHRTAD
jgi:hypothetical protein